jgi:hypothetical protein
VYATDPNYGSKLKSIMSSINLSKSAGNGTRSASGGGTTNTTSHDVKIAQINVQTQATDAKGIARDIGPAVKQYAFAVQSNTGLTS